MKEICLNPSKKTNKKKLNKLFNKALSSGEIGVINGVNWIEPNKFNEKDLISGMKMLGKAAWK